MLDERGVRDAKADFAEGQGRAERAVLILRFVGLTAAREVQRVFFKQRAVLGGGDLIRLHLNVREVDGEEVALILAGARE